MYLFVGMIMLMEFNWFLAIGLFFASILLDAVFALYTLAVVKKNAMAAANLTVLTYMLEAAGIVSYVKNLWYLIPVAAGAFVGTYFIVKREANMGKRRTKRKK
jgi:hypothetical protein